MKKLNQTEKRLWTIMIAVSGHLDSYTLFNRIKVSFPAFSKASKKLIDMEYIEEKEFRIKLTQKGREYVLKNNLSIKSEDQEWKKIPAKLLRKNDYLMEMYIPSRRILDKKTFHLINNEIEE